MNDDDHSGPVGDVLADRSVRAFLLATFATNVAVAAQATALGKQVFDLTHHELDLGLLGLAEFAPAFLLVLVSGPIADRFDRRRVARISITAQAGCSVVLAWMAHRHVASLGAILGVVFAFGIARAFTAPSVRALPPNIVGLARLPRLIPLNSLSMQAALVAGPVMGGFLYVSGPPWPYVGAAVASMVGVGALAMVRVLPADPAEPATPAGEGTATVDASPLGAPAVEPVAVESAVPGRTRRAATLREAVEGLRLIRSEPILLGAISLDLFAVLFGGAVALLPAIAEQQLHVGAEGLGWLRAAGGLGAAFTATALAARPRQRRIGATLMVVVAVFGLGTIGLGLTHSFAVAFVAMLVLSAADAVSMFIRSTLSPLIVPDVLRGRVLAVEAVFIGASNELGAFESGVVGQLIGAPAAVVSGGIATVVVVVIWSVAFPALRRIDRFSDLHPIDVTATG